MLFSRAAGGEVDRGEEALLGDLAVEHKFAVAGALELLEDHLIAHAPGVNQATGDDREAAGLFGVAGGAEDLLGDLERPRVNAAGHGATAGGVLAGTVEGVAEAGE